MLYFRYSSLADSDHGGFFFHVILSQCDGWTRMDKGFGGAWVLKISNLMSSSLYSLLWYCILGPANL
jgi:hypothetical protein